MLKIKNINPQGVYVCGFYLDLGMLFKQAKEIGLKTQFYAAITFKHPALKNITGEEAIEGVIYTSTPFDCSLSYYQKFCEKYNKKFNKNVDYRAAYGYDVIRLLAYVSQVLINNRKAVNAENIKDELLKIHNYQGAMWPIEFDSEGNNAKATVILKTVKNGQFVPYEE